jgi:hypothetical protein
MVFGVFQASTGGIPVLPDCRGMVSLSTQQEWGAEGPTSGAEKLPVTGG